ncbi:hypothetical protein Q3Y53_11060 [Synechococcus sp. YX-04-1]|uniref:hypothetical protein n=1 Tax=Synechococcus sp. YX-04-1 TaxID=3062778 RepID=UPI0026E2540C|nr:hypothetical protein [Synechococcus sp. YX-04-1]MDO6353081.1 hypothetical protein [Synechococcus sp. YX-04-1]
MIRIEHLVFCVQLVDKFQRRCIPIHVEFEAHEALSIGAHVMNREFKPEEG